MRSRSILSLQCRLSLSWLEFVLPIFDALEQAFNDPLNWVHTGVWAHGMMLSVENMEKHQDKVWSYTATPIWTCCKSMEKGGKGCKRIDKPVVH